MDIDPARWLREPFVAGLLGAVVALKFAPGATAMERLFNIGCGALCAGFVSPAAAESLHLVSPAMQGAFAFAIGMFGLSLAAAIVVAIRDLKLAEIVAGWLKRKE